MALKKCKECGHQVSTKASTCPSCGAKQSKQAGPVGTILVLLFGGLVVVGIANSPDTTSQNDDGASPTGTGGTGSTESSADTDSSGNQSDLNAYPMRKRLFAHKTINVRAGAGTDHEVVGQVKRGDKLWVDGVGKWQKIIAGRFKNNYIYTPLLEQAPIPKIEVVSFNWRTDPDFAGTGKVIWNAEIRNNTDSYVKSVRVEFTTYDGNGSIMDSDWSYAQGLSPGGTAAVKGYATYFGGEEKGRLQIKGWR